MRMNLPKASESRSTFRACWWLGITSLQNAYHITREREVVCLAHTNSAWSMFAMNCRERLQWSLLVTNEEAGPRRLAPPEPDFSERMWATFW